VNINEAVVAEGSITVTGSAQFISDPLVARS